MKPFHIAKTGKARGMMMQGRQTVASEVEVHIARAYLHNPVVSLNM